MLLGIAALLIVPWVPAAIFAIMSGWLFALIVWSYPLWVLICSFIAIRLYKSAHFKPAVYWASIPLLLLGIFFAIIFIGIAIAALMARNG